jgi:hypothetical protein
MFSDETYFHFNGYANPHNTVYMAQQNPHAAVDAHHQTSTKAGLTVWCPVHENTSVSGRRTRSKNKRNLQFLKDVLNPHVDKMTSQ